MTFLITGLGAWIGGLPGLPWLESESPDDELLDEPGLCPYSLLLELLLVLVDGPE